MLLSGLQDIANVTVLALKASTAINVLYRDMPRLSVDIDQTYQPVADLKSSLEEIDDALKRIVAAITHRNTRITVSKVQSQIKIETTQRHEGWYIRRVARSVFALIPKHADTATWMVDRFLAACRLRQGVTITCHSALELHVVFLFCQPSAIDCWPEIRSVFRDFSLGQKGFPGSSVRINCPGLVANRIAALRASLLLHGGGGLSEAGFDLVELVFLLDLDPEMIKPLLPGTRRNGKIDSGIVDHPLGVIVLADLGRLSEEA